MPQLNSSILLIDTLNQVISDPLGRHLWRRLVAQVIQIDDIDIHRQIAKRILNEINQQGLTGFYSAIFLGHVFRIKNEINRAGKVLEELRPIHLDRIMSYINYEWGNIVAQARSGTEFKAMMDAANIPRLMAITNSVVFENAALPTSTRVHQQRKKIAIYAPQLINDKHPPTTLVLEHARLLQSLDFEVKIFSCQEQSIPDIQEYLSDDGHLKLPPYDPAVAKHFHFRTPVEIVRAQEQFSLPFRAQSILHMINHFEPNLCFFIGHQSLILQTLYQSYPVLGLNISSIAPDGNLDLWLNAEVSSTEGAGLSATPAYFHPFRVIKKKNYAPISRDQLQLSSDAIVLVTAGARLQKEIHGEWAKSMIEICKRFSHVVWLVIGADGEMPVALRDANTHNIISMPHQKNLMGIYHCCDIYVNPPRLGGGFSVAEAMAEGLACLAFVDTDGGKKLGTLAAQHTEDYFAELVELINNPLARKNKANQMAEIFDATINLENSLPSLSRAIELTEARFTQRKEVP